MRLAWYSMQNPLSVAQKQKWNWYTRFPLLISAGKSDRVTYYDRLHFLSEFPTVSEVFPCIDSMNAKLEVKSKSFQLAPSSASEIFSSSHVPSLPLVKKTCHSLSSAGISQATENWFFTPSKVKRRTWAPSKDTNMNGSTMEPDRPNDVPHNLTRNWFLLSTAKKKLTPPKKKLLISQFSEQKWN